MRLWCAILMLSIPLVPSPSSGLPNLRAIDGFLQLSLADSTDCLGAGECVAVDVSVNAATNPLDVLLFDLQLAWDTSYWVLDSIVPRGISPGIVERDDGLGFVDDLFGDVGVDPPIAVGEVLFQLLFEVEAGGNRAPTRSVFEIGDLSPLDPFFDRPVLVADENFDTFSPTPNALILTPEPSTGTLLVAGLLGLALCRRAELSR